MCRRAFCRITKVIYAENRTIYAQWKLVTVGYLYNGTVFSGYAEEYWLNNTGRDITFNYSIFNKKRDPDSDLCYGSYIYICSEANYISSGSCAVKVKGGTSGETGTGTFTVPAGYYVCYFGQNNAWATVTIWEQRITKVSNAENVTTYAQWQAILTIGTKATFSSSPANTYNSTNMTGYITLSNNYDENAFTTSGNKLVTNIPGIYTYKITGKYNGYFSHKCYVYLTVNGTTVATLSSTKSTGAAYEYEYHNGTNSKTATLELQQGDVVAFKYKMGPYIDGTVTGSLSYNGD